MEKSPRMKTSQIFGVVLLGPASSQLAQGPRHAGLGGISGSGRPRTRWQKNLLLKAGEDPSEKGPRVLGVQLHLTAVEAPPRKQRCSVGW